jgi:hypothetical protein
LKGVRHDSTGELYTVDRRSVFEFFNLCEGTGYFFLSHARAGGHPVYSALNFLDACLRSNDGSALSTKKIYLNRLLKTSEFA